MKQVIIHVLETIAGFLLAAAATLLSGLLLVWALAALDPNWYPQWRYLPTWKRAVIVAPGVTLIVGLGFFFWKRHRFLAIGVLLFLLADLFAALFG